MLWKHWRVGKLRHKSLGIFISNPNLISVKYHHVPCFISCEASKKIRAIEFEFDFSRLNKLEVNPWIKKQQHFQEMGLSFFCQFLIVFALIACTWCAQLVQVNAGLSLVDTHTTLYSISLLFLCQMGLVCSSFSN